MGSIKTIREYYLGTAPQMVGNGFSVSNYIPGIKNYRGNELSPFILLDYNAPYLFPPSTYRRGVGEHPHRGFETVSIVYSGEIEHRDSSGGGGIIGPGDVQWMTAGNGIMHDEFQSHAFTSTGGIQHMIQLWVNLPRDKKKIDPAYQSITHDQIPTHSIDDIGSIVRVIAGKYQSLIGAAHTHTPINLFDIQLQPLASTSFDSPINHNSFILVTEGKVKIQNTSMHAAGDFIVFNHDGETLSIEAMEKSRVLFASGLPIEEPIARYGPFVMNTQTEIIESLRLVEKGEFGKISPR